MPRLLVLDESVSPGLRGILTAFPTNHWDTIRADLAAIAAACDGAGQGTYTVVNVARPPRRCGRPSARSSRTSSAPRCQRPRRV